MLSHKFTTKPSHSTQAYLSPLSKAKKKNKHVVSFIAFHSLATNFLFCTKIHDLQNLHFFFNIKSTVYIQNKIFIKFSFSFIYLQVALINHNKSRALKTAPLEIRPPRL